MKQFVFIIAVLWLAVPSFAVEPDEILPDPILEKQAREISSVLRCLVCQNESIDESSASLARDLRILVRERLLLGETNDQVLEFIVSRYGEYVLLKPKISGINLVLWLIGPLCLLFSVFLSGLYIRNKNRVNKIETSSPLSDKERSRFEEIMRR